MAQRAPAPQRLRHHPRPAISFKELIVSCEPLAVSSALTAILNLALQTVLKFSKLLTAYRSLLTTSNSQSGNRGLVFLGIRIREHALLELVQFPNFQVCQITEYRYVAHHLRALSQQRVNQHATLRVHRRLLAVVVRPVKELAPRRIHRRQERQSLFDGFPLRRSEERRVGKECRSR